MSQTQVTDARPAIRQGFPALVLSFVVLVAAVVGLVVRPADAHVFRYVLEPGQTRTYSMSMRSVFTPQGIAGFAESIDETMTGRMTIKVVEVRTDGSTLFDLSLFELSVSSSSAPPESGSMRMLVSNSGKLIDIEGTGILGGFDFGALLGVANKESGETFGATSILPSFPETAIGPGDTWTETEEVPLPFSDTKLQVNVRGEHQGFQDTTYGRAARVFTKTSAPFDFGFSFADILQLAGEALPAELNAPEIRAFRMVVSGKMLGDLTALVVPDTGDLVRMQMDMKMNFGFRFENAPAEFALSGGPESFSMLGDMRMKLDRIA